MKHYKGTYLSVGIAAFYFFHSICNAVSQAVFKCMELLFTYTVIS